jgi:adenylate kinase
MELEMDLEGEEPTQVPPMDKLMPNILVTGVPGCGKTTISKLLHAQLNEAINEKLATTGVEYYKYINVGRLCLPQVKL